MRYKIGDKILTKDGLMCTIMGIDTWAGGETVYWVDSEDFFGVMANGVRGKIVGNKLIKGGRC